MKRLTELQVIHLTTKEMYNYYVELLTDTMWDNQQAPYNFSSIIKSLAIGDITRIRKLFKDGYTLFLVGTRNMTIIDLSPDKREYEIELRIYNEEDTLLGVIINSEINY
jgi:hypothetical protein